MKTTIKLTILGTAILALTSASCEQAVVTNSKNANAAKSNQAAQTNSNLMANGNSMSGTKSEMPMNGNSSTTEMSPGAMNHEGMNHDGMNHGAMQSSPNAASALYDLQFLDTMTHHHQGAVEMAKMVDGKTQNAELKKFAAKIISDQNKEIEQMKDWREKWFAGKPAAMNMEMPGMTDSMKMMSGGEMKKLAAATGQDFDLKFLEMMTPHHVGAVVMSREALARAEHSEIKTFANQIIKAQEAEIKMMNDWSAKWGK